MDIFIGVDPSINSTGICILYYDNNILVEEKYYIIYPSKDKLTKKQVAANNKLNNFEYVSYPAEDLKEYKEEYFIYEKKKTENIIHLMSTIEDIISNINIENNNIYALQEGISYGSSIRTKAIYDLAGINFLLRSIFIEKQHINFIISPPANIKKFVTGKGNSNKDIINKLFLSTHQKMEIIPKIDDLADAYYMAKFAKKIKEQS